MTDPTCTSAGTVEYLATVEGMDYTSSHTKLLPATGHGEGVIQEDGERHYTVCSICEAELDVPHNWTAAGEPTVGTCREPGTQLYICDCGREKVESLGYGEHTFQYKEDVLKDAATCLYVKRYVCTTDGCNASTEDGAYNNHNYVTVIEQEATCSQAGQKVSRCENCHDVRSTEEIPVNDSHIWDDGVEANGVRTHTCGLCGKTKTSAVAGNDGVINNDTLQNADEVVVGDATVSMDNDVKENLDTDKEIVITVDKLDKEDILIDGQLTQDQKDQIGDNLVYDFNMEYTDGEKVDFSSGMITVSLPYELAEGEDIDSIDVWYIADDGTLELVKATYSNGFITFQTNHFSYYTVTRLTPAERCARYGHIWTQSSKTPTCTEAGYTKEVCQRCTIAFRVVEPNKTVSTHVDCTVILKVRSDEVGRFQDRISVSVTCEHQFGDWSYVDPDNHSQVCTVCQQQHLQSHQWGNGILGENPDRPGTNATFHTCQICKGEKIVGVESAPSTKPTEPANPTVPSDPAEQPSVPSASPQLPDQPKSGNTVLIVVIVVAVAAFAAVIMVLWKKKK